MDASYKRAGYTPSSRAGYAARADLNARTAVRGLPRPEQAIAAVVLAAVSVALVVARAALGAES